MDSSIYFHQVHTRLALNWKINFVCYMAPYCRICFSQPPYCKHLCHYMSENKKSKLIAMTIIIFQGKQIKFVMIRAFTIMYYFILQFRLSINSEEVRRMSFNRDQRASRLVLAMNIAYIACWFPYGVLCVIHIAISQR